MVFARPLNDHSVAVALLNTGHFAGPHNISVNFQKVSTLSLRLKLPVMMISSVTKRLLAEIVVPK